MLVIKNILKKIKLNNFFLLLTLLCFLTGLYKEYLIFTSIIIIHELGHISSSKLLKWNIKKLELNIYGGNIKYEEYINRPLIEELIVAISGILIQSLYFLLIHYLYQKGIVSNRTFTLFANYNYCIITFNLLPLPPLDGYKIFNVLMNTIIPYKKTLNFCPLVSFFLLVVLIIYIFFNKINGNSIIILFLLIMKLVNEFKNRKYIFNKFLLERYLYNINFKNMKKIKKGINYMYKDYSHIFLKNNIVINEKKMLKNYFKN